ncbi:MAG: hypothetical protein NTX44_02890 [Ignavibacteriales bacterium]|nr:hypothetical protein [Ignavibacteriales bacterium]
MKYFYSTVTTLYLSLAIYVSIAQERKFELGRNIVEPIRVGAISEASLVYRMDDDRHFLFPRKSIDISCNSSNKVKYAGSQIPLPIFDITGLNYEEKSNGYLIQIQCSKNLPHFESWLKSEGNDTWLSVTIVNAIVDLTGIKIIKMPRYVKDVLIFQSRSSVQLTFRLEGKIRVAELLQIKGSNNILVAVHMIERIYARARIETPPVMHVSMTRREVW